MNIFNILTIISILLHIILIIGLLYLRQNYKIYISEILNEMMKKKNNKFFKNFI